MFGDLSANQKLITLLRDGGVAVIRTDTLYGIVASAGNRSAVERVYNIKHRNLNKSCIVLIDHPNSAYGNNEELAIDIRDHHETPTSFLIVSEEAPEWLLRTNKELAYRVPAKADLRALLERTGPLIAPSANPEGLPPALTIDQARKYFGESIDMYVDGGEVPADTPPSRLLRVNDDGTVERLR